MVKNCKQNFIRKWLLIANLAVFYNVMSIEAQQSVHLTMDDAISNSLNNNKEVQIAAIDQEIAAATYKQTQAVFLPQVGASYTALTTNNPLNAFGFKLQQKLITQNDFDPDKLNHPGATPDFMAKVDIQQPLINMDMLYLRKSAQKQAELYQYKTQRTREFVIFEVQKAYMQLQLAYKAVDVLKEALKTAQEIQLFTSKRMEQGLLQKSDLLNVQVQVSAIESNLAEAESNIKNASDYLSVLMGKPEGAVYIVGTMWPKETFGNDSTVKVPDNRADFKAIEKAIEATDMIIKSGHMSYLPKLNAFASYQLNDKKPTGFGTDAYVDGIQLSWDVFKGSRTKSTIAIHKLERNKLTGQLDLQKEQGQMDLNKTRRDLVDARFKIQQQKSAVEHATEALRIVQNRYQQGLVNTTDVLMVQAQLSNQQLDYEQSVFAGNVTAAYLQLLVSSVNK